MKKMLKPLYVKIVTIYLDSINSFEFLKARILNKGVIYSLYARVNNFGDLFNKDLIQFFNKQLVYTASYKKSKAALTGSILGSYPRDFKGYVLGSGFLLERYNRIDNSWKVKMIRGPLSASQCGLKKETVYADPGILAAMVYPFKKEKKYELGIIPHSRDVSYVSSLNFDTSVLIIHPRRNPDKVASDIMKCRYIASSSLHGLIFADSFRIPNIHLKFGDKLKGGLHKFKDYYLGMDAIEEHLNFKEGMSVVEIVNQCKLRFSNAYLNHKQKQTIDIMNAVLDEISA